MADDKKDDKAPDPKPAPADPPAKSADADKIAALEAQLTKIEAELSAAKKPAAKGEASKPDQGDIPKLSAAELTAATEEMRALRTELAELKAGKGKKRGFLEGVFG